jgi:hypothetical protein
VGSNSLDVFDLIMGPIGAGVFLIGVLSFLTGTVLFLMGVKSRGSADTSFGWSSMVHSHGFRNCSNDFRFDDTNLENGR